MICEMCNETKLDCLREKTMGEYNYREMYCLKCNQTGIYRVRKEYV